MTAIPMDQPEVLKSAIPGDEILEIVRPVYALPNPHDGEWDHFRFLLRNLSKFPSQKALKTENRTLLLHHIGGGILGRGNIAILIRLHQLIHKATYFQVRHWKVLGVVD